MTQHRSTLDLLSQYAASHRDRRNIATHFVGVPVIVLGFSVLLARLRGTPAGLEIDAAWLVFCAVAAWYLSRRGPLALNLAVTGATGVLVALAHALANGSAGHWLGWGAGLSVLGWLIQFVGHYYEGRKPAFVDDVRGLFVGPMFVTAEAMFMLGWNKPLLAEIERRAGPTHLRDLAHPA